MVSYIFSPYLFPPRHHSFTQWGFESETWCPSGRCNHLTPGTQHLPLAELLLFIPPTVLGHCGGKWNSKIYNLRKPDLVISQKFMPEWVFFLLITSQKFNRRLKAKPAPAVQEEPHPGKCDAFEAAPCDRDGRSFFPGWHVALRVAPNLRPLFENSASSIENGFSQRGKEPTFHKDDENSREKSHKKGGQQKHRQLRVCNCTIGEIVSTFRMNRGKNEGKTWHPTDFQETLESLLMHVQYSNVQHPDNNNLKIDFGPPSNPFKRGNLWYFSLTKSHPSQIFSKDSSDPLLGEANAIAWEVLVDWWVPNPAVDVIYIIPDRSARGGAGSFKK